MKLASSAPPSTVTFPVSESSPKNVQPAPYPRPPYLPFRRISLPTAPTLMHRESVISVASFDSLPEEGEPPENSIPAIMQNIYAGGRGGPTSVESPRRRRRRDITVKPVNDARESKRRKVIEEFYETERAYVDGLELIYSHFLTPIIASLDTPNPLLDRSSLTSVFSNFIDIWNLHRSFFSSLSSLLSKAAIPPSVPTSNESPPPLSPILLSHFPYLSLYNPFVTSFPSTISALTDLVSPPSAINPNPQYNPAFASFLSAQEADPRCGKLKLRDWLLTIVQRCPRYLLLLKDLIKCTDVEDAEHGQLTAVHTLVSKITLTLNTSLHTHAQTLALLSLQRSTPNLPFQLIVPGRTFLKRGPLLMLERSAQPKEREFLLFSDCLLWLAAEEVERAWKGDWGISRVGWGAGYVGGSGITESPASSPPRRPPMMRSRSKSEAELSLLKVNNKTVESNELEPPSPSTPTTPSKHAARNAVRKSYHPPSNMIKRHGSSNGGDERWVYKGRAELVDLEVIVSPTIEPGEERRFEILSPEGSFVLYAGTEEERDEWSSTIRQAKAQLLVSLNITHPNSTLTSSSSTNHLRRSLQALPFPPSDDRIATIRERHGDVKDYKGKGKQNSELQERRRKVEHWVPAIWIPDEKTGGCMRCGRAFGWRRRRHHCRLCGRCVCASCSGRTFFISDPKDDSSRPARACDACYETVFPLLIPSPDVTGENARGKDADTITSLSNFPSWLSMPSLPVTSTPQALMAIDREPSRDSIPEELPDIGLGRVRLKPPQHSRPRSYHQLLEDFEDNDQGHYNSPNLAVEGQTEDEDDTYGSLDREHLHTPNSHTPSSSPPRKENTARRSKRFSVPAIALQTTSVTAHTGFVGGDIGTPGDGSRINRRFSLVLGSGRNHSASVFKGQAEMSTKVGKIGRDLTGTGKTELGKGIAIGKLNELLNRKRE